MLNIRVGDQVLVRLSPQGGRIPARVGFMATRDCVCMFALQTTIPVPYEHVFPDPKWLAAKRQEAIDLLKHRMRTFKREMYPAL